MHIIECYFESSGFDYNLLAGGIAVYIWNLSKRIAVAGHKVSIVTASNGQLDYLRSHYSIEPMSYRHAYELPLRLDPGVWKAKANYDIPLDTAAYKLNLEGIDIYFLDNEMLRLYPQTYYPPYESKGSDIGFHKPLAFQVECIKFIRQHFKDEAIVVHAHEPYYQYLLPLAFKDDSSKIMVSTVQSNMPVNKKVYKPKVQRLLELLEVRADLESFDDKLPADEGLLQCMEQQLPKTHLHYPYPENYLNLLAPILEHSDHIDFLSPGQMRFYSTFADTPFEQMFHQLSISKVIQRNSHKFFVGWCAMSELWHSFNPANVDRVAVLHGLCMNPAWPTFYHNARYAVEHKGQVELMRAIEAVLESDSHCNFIVRCISGTGIDNPYFHAVKERFPHNIHLDWSMVSDETLMHFAGAADFCLFPSKFEMDTFLIAQGEAMLCGAVPIATAQEGTSHFEHALPLEHPQATGMAVNRSFAENDDLLVLDLINRIREAVVMFWQEPATYQRLSRNARQVASRFTWDMAADAHLNAFNRGKTIAAKPPIVIPAAPTRQQMLLTFEEAFEMADFDRCRALNQSLGLPELAQRLTGRVVLRRTESGGLAVLHTFVGAVTVDLFVRMGQAVGTFDEHPMEREKDGFFFHLPAMPADPELYFRLTLRSGRMCWDRSPHA